MKQAQLRFKLANGGYTHDFGQLDIDVPGGGTPSADGARITYESGVVLLLMPTPINSVEARIPNGITLEMYYAGKHICWGCGRVNGQICRSLRDGKPPSRRQSERSFRVGIFLINRASA